MKSMIATACLTILVLAGTTFASHHSSRGTTASSHRNTKNLGSSHDYHRTHGHSFSHGYYYQGRNHRHWTNYRWSSQYGCYTYLCPSTNCYYYWSESTQCYYPMSYADVETPTRSTLHLDLNVTYP